MNSILKSAEIKVTPVRVAVLSRLIEASRPLSHGEIHAKIPDMDRVTLYRTLSTFVEADIAHQVQGLDGTWRFCAHSSGTGGCPGNHPHFLCAACGRMMCLLDQSMPRLDVPDACNVHGKQLVAYGICGECLNGRQYKK
jgi:Fur family ferric uptake transcriptional regulator/Fur family zinc uptake transcriptional regulator